MENRRDFFKYLGTFAAGVVGAKIASYTPKKEEPKEKLMVSSTITIKHGDKEYHPLVVEKTTYDEMKSVATNVSHSFAIQGLEPTIRKINV
jgi:hypothetical protein